MSTSSSDSESPPAAKQSKNVSEASNRLLISSDGKISIECPDDIKRLQNLEPQRAKSIKKIEFEELELTEENINGLKPILGQIESIRMENVLIEIEFYQSFFKYCPNVKHLAIKGVADKLIIGSDNAWLQRNYPKLESVHFDDTDDICETYRGNGESVKELAQFFQLNPNLRTFSTTYDYFKENWKWMLEGKASFDLLKLQTPLSICRLDHYIADPLKKLHAKDVYKRLRLSNLKVMTQSDLKLIGTIPAVETLYLEEVECGIAIPKMTSLKEFGLVYAPDIRTPDRLAQSLANVQRIYIQAAAPADILPFIRYSTKAEALFVDRLLDGTHLKKGGLDVVALNAEREKLNGASKMTIYVDEKIYLATQRASVTKCSLVELEKAEAYNGDNQKFG